MDNVLPHTQVGGMEVQCGKRVVSIIVQTRGRGTVFVVLTHLLTLFVCVYYTGSTYYTGSLSISHPVMSKISFVLILLVAFTLAMACLSA